MRCDGVLYEFDHEIMVEAELDYFQSKGGPSLNLPRLGLQIKT